jgi:hypothetical protein
MIGTEQDALRHAVTECATAGTEWVITISDGSVVWSIERDEKVDANDLSFPVIVHARGAMASVAIAILTEVTAP